MSSYEVFFKIGILFAVVAIPVKLVALVLPWWTYTEIDFFGETWKSNLGLWKWCRETIDVNDESNTTCRKFTSPEDYIVTTRCILVIAFILLVLGLVTVSAQKWFVPELIFLAFLGPLILCTAGCFSWIATATYAEEHIKTPGNKPNDIHAGWMLALTSSGLCFLSGTLFSVGKICDN